MNAKVEQQIREMKNQTIGVEVEMNGITRENAAKTAATFFGTGRCEYTARRNGYYTWSAWDDQGREWKFQRDVSINGPDEEKCELVTPILTWRTSKPYRNFADSSATKAQRATQQEDAEFTSTSEQTVTHRKHSATWRTLWQATKASWLRHLTLTPTASTAIAERSTKTSLKE